MSNNKKKALVITLSAICATIIAGVITCYFIFPAQTKQYAMTAWEWLNKPLPIAGVTTITICLFLWRVFVSTSFGKRQISEFKRQVEEIKEEYNLKDIEKNKVIAELKDKNEQLALRIGELEDFIEKMVVLIPNKKVKQLGEQFYGESEKEKKYRALQYTAVGGMFASVITPFIILGIANFSEWFQNENGWKIGLGASLGLAVAGIAIFLVTAKKEKESNVTAGWITLVVCWFAVAFVFKLLASIYEQIFGIMMWTGLGLCSAFGLDLVAKKEKEKADAYKSARKNVEQETIQEQAKREVEEEKKKVKIKVVK